MSTNLSPPRFLPMMEELTRDGEGQVFALVWVRPLRNANMSMGGLRSAGVTYFMG